MMPNIEKVFTIHILGLEYHLEADREHIGGLDMEDIWANSF